MSSVANKQKQDQAQLNARVKQSAESYTGSAQVALRLEKDLQKVVELALCEDLGIELKDDLQPLLFNEHLLEADVTSSSIVAPGARARALMIAKAQGVVAGLEVAKTVFRTLDPECKVEFLIKEGFEVTTAPTNLARIEGNARALLIAERTALNLIQRMSGIATVARTFAVKAADFGIAVVDTRKTTPGLRTLEKYAVQVGGAANHRYGLFDAILIKDNHIKIAGSVTGAIKLARQKHPKMPVEVETTCEADIAQALEENAEKILLDNMTPDQVRQAVNQIDKRSIIEVSGGVNARNFDSYLIEGVNAISIGALTHSVRSMDISLDIEV